MVSLNFKCKSIARKFRIEFQEQNSIANDFASNLKCKIQLQTIFGSNFKRKSIASHFALENFDPKTFSIHFAPRIWPENCLQWNCKQLENDLRSQFKRKIDCKRFSDQFLVQNRLQSIFRLSSEGTIRLQAIFGPKFDGKVVCGCFFHNLTPENWCKNIFSGNFCSLFSPHPVNSTLPPNLRPTEHNKALKLLKKWDSNWKYGRFVRCKRILVEFLNFFC